MLLRSAIVATDKQEICVSVCYSKESFYVQHMGECLVPKIPVEKSNGRRHLMKKVWTKKYMSFKVIYFHILIKHKEQELGRKQCGGVKTKTHGVKKCYTPDLLLKCYFTLSFWHGYSLSLMRQIIYHVEVLTFPTGPTAVTLLNLCWNYLPLIRLQNEVIHTVKRTVQERNFWP